MDRPTCKTCPHFVCMSCEENPSDPNYGPCCITENGIGSHDQTICRRYPPIRMEDPGLNPPSFFAWPEVEEYEGCGEHPDFPAYLASLKSDSENK